MLNYWKTWNLSILKVINLSELCNVKYYEYAVTDFKMTFEAAYAQHAEEADDAAPRIDDCMDVLAAIEKDAAAAFPSETAAAAAVEASVRESAAAAAAPAVEPAVEAAPAVDAADVVEEK